MDYMLICCIDEAAWEALPPSERDTVMRDYGALIDDLTRDGRYRAGGKLKGTATATSVRQRGGKTVLTDGPFAETKEQLGGYHVVACADIDEAIAIAERIPSLRCGAVVEVRPLDYSTAEVPR